MINEIRQLTVSISKTLLAIFILSCATCSMMHANPHPVRTMPPPPPQVQRPPPPPSQTMPQPPEKIEQAEAPAVEPETKKG